MTEANFPFSTNRPRIMALPTLPELRQEIDRIDAAMHDLLIERGTIIDTLIEVKKTVDSGSAFRPGREASMMRALAERHHGLLPFDTVESIWRVIISTFTYVQAPYAVHADISIGDAPMRDTARFHFGFTVPYHTHEAAAAVIDAVSQSQGDLGMFSTTTKGPWWHGLQNENAPKIIARLPFVERPDHPAGMPVFVISKPLADAAVRDRVLYAAKAERWRGDITAALASDAITIEARHAQDGFEWLLFSAPGPLPLSRILSIFSALGLSVSDLYETGSHANRFQLSRPE
jgi:chorismate mutase